MDTPKKGPALGAREDAYYAILAGGARYQLFCSLLDFNLPPLLSCGPTGRSVDAIVDMLKLERHRGRKWLHALTLAGFLEMLPGEAGQKEAPGAVRVRLGAMLRGMFGEDGQGGWFYREFLRYFRASLTHPLQVVLHGAPVSPAVHYPPTDHGDMLLLHEWMRNTALHTLEVIRRHVDFSSVKRLLDVGGGDGTMAFALWKVFPQLRLTVFNLPGPATLVQEQATTLGAWDRVVAQPGDFRTDPLPSGHDMVLFSRVLADWPPQLCAELLRKAYAALVPGGRLVLCEPFADENPDLTLAWEQSYLPYDDFGLKLYKPQSLYVEMLTAAGFHVGSVHPRDDNTIHGVIQAEKRDL